MAFAQLGHFLLPFSYWCLQQFRSCLLLFWK